MEAEDTRIELIQLRELNSNHQLAEDDLNSYIDKTETKLKAIKIRIREIAKDWLGAKKVEEMDDDELMRQMTEFQAE